MNNRIDLTWLEGDEDRVLGIIEDNICGDYDYVENLLTELKRCYERLDEVEYRLEMAEDVLGRSDWNFVYRELITPPE